MHTVCSANPLDDLPSEAARALQDALLRPVDGDIGGVLERCDAARELLERWQDAFFGSLPDEIDLDEERRWAAAAGMSLDELETAYGDVEDDLPLDVSGLDGEDLELLLDEEDDEEDPRAVLPEELVSVLERELLLLPIRNRLEALVAAADLVAGWSDLLADDEKLLGHLVLRHGDGTGVVDHEAMADRHAELHGQTGPGHSR